MQTSTTGLDVLRHTDDQYDIFEHRVETQVTTMGGPLFRTDADGLFEVYLKNLPANRQHYNCRCCQAFIERIGGLVRIDEFGQTISAIWSFVAPDFFASSVGAMRQIVERAKVTGPFLSSEPVFGTKSSPKGWTHLSGQNMSVFKDRKLSASQREAELIEDYRILSSKIDEFTIAQVEVALSILKSEQFPGWEKGHGSCEWYLDIRRKLASARHRNLKCGILWRAVAEAPPGFSHIRNTVVGKLLENVKSGMSFEECRRAWSKLMNPLQYQRPTAPVREGQIAAAEKLIEKLGMERSLERTYAQLEQVKGVVWRPRDATKDEVASGIFGHLKKAPAAPSIQIPNQSITWAKFNRDVLPGAAMMEVNCPSHGHYCGIVTAAHYDAPPVLQWDSPEDRNPVSHYFYVNGSSAQHWGIAPGWRPVSAIFPTPSNGLSHFQAHIVFNVAAMHDSRAQYSGSGLFPETLKSELREIRAVLEAHSKSRGISGRGNANGLAFSDGNPVTVRVNGNAMYKIDRWE